MQSIQRDHVDPNKIFVSSGKLLNFIFYEQGIRIRKSCKQNSRKDPYLQQRFVLKFSKHTTNFIEQSPNPIGVLTKTVIEQHESTVQILQKAEFYHQLKQIRFIIQFKHISTFI